MRGTLDECLGRRGTGHMWRVGAYRTLAGVFVRPSRMGQA